jgi:hypothetical protein
MVVSDRARRAARARGLIFVGAMLLISRTGASGDRHQRRRSLEAESAAKSLGLGIGEKNGKPTAAIGERETKAPRLGAGGEGGEGGEGRAGASAAAAGDAAAAPAAHAGVAVAVASDADGAANGTSSSLKEEKEGGGGGGEGEEEGLGSVADHRNADGTLMFPADLSGTFKGKWTLVPSMGADGSPNGTTGRSLPAMKAFLGRVGTFHHVMLQ